ncbi:MAG: GAF domain-containing protein [Armatimonadetes bacterium]|nr:GAF domain-containing protein [Armatimonadota bacterium]
MAHAPRPHRLRLSPRISWRSETDPAKLHAALEERDRQMSEAMALIEVMQAEIEEREAEADALRRVGEATGSAFDLEEILKVTADIAIQVTETDSCQVYLYDRANDDLVLRAADETGQSMVRRIRLKLGEGITGWVARERRYVAISRNATRDHRFRYFPEIREEEYESILSVPLVSRNELIGVVNVRTRKPHEYSRIQVRMLSGIANQVAGAIDKARRTRRLETTAAHLRNLSEVSKTVTENVYVDEMLQSLVDMTARTMNYKVCTVMLADKATGELEIKATQSSSLEYTNKPRVRIGESISGQAVETGTVVMVRDVRTHPEYRFPDIAERAGLCSMAAVPLTYKGDIIGVLNCYTEAVHEFTPEEVSILRSLGAQAALAIVAAKFMMKSAVVREMHHRVKNNLQQIVGLVRLQAKFSKYITVEDAMTDTLNRILAIAAVHELLLRDDLESVCVNRLAEQILTATKQSVVQPNMSIHMAVSGPEIWLPLAQATSVALVLNELVQNAVEHGFRELTQGRVHVDLDDNGERIEIRVTNDGQPLPEGFNPAANDRLGLRIVNDLVRGGLGGAFEMTNRNGIEATVRFPRL